MTRLLLVVAAALSMTAPALAQPPQGGQGGNRPPVGMPFRGPAPVRLGTGRIRGHVFSADTGSPVRLAQIAVTSTDGPARFATTDAEGRFELSQLPAGRYTISATKGGYVRLQFGQDRPFEPGTPVDLGDGETIEQIDFRLPHGGVIVGRVTDDGGEPITQASIQVQRLSYGPGGQKRPMPAGNSNPTDDLGQFRVWGLMPGDYIVSATGPQVPRGPATAVDSQDGYAPTYFPGTPSAAEAQTIRVTLGQEVSAYFSMSSVRMARVSGTVVDSQGRLMTGGQVLMLPSAGALMMGRNGAPIGADGAFAIAGVAPGDYVLEVRLLQPRGATGPQEFAEVSVAVGGADLTGLTITTGPGATIAGRVVFEGRSTKPPGTARMGVTVSMGDSTGMPRSLMATVGDDGGFQVRGASGKVLLRVVSPPAGWTLKSVELAGQDVTDAPYELKGNENITGVEITLTDRLTDLAGSVRDSNGQPSRDSVVVVLPGDEKDGLAATRFVRRMDPDDEGRFHARGLPPGRYIAAAVVALEQGQEWDPALRDQIRRSGKSFSLTEGQTLTLDLELAKP